MKVTLKTLGFVPFSAFDAALTGKARADLIEVRINPVITYC